MSADPLMDLTHIAYCDHLRHAGVCGHGCYDEPRCITDQPSGGWNGERDRASRADCTLRWEATVWVSSPHWTGLYAAFGRLIGPGFGPEVALEYSSAPYERLAMTWTLGPMEWEPAMDGLERAKARISNPRRGVIPATVEGSRLQASDAPWYPVAERGPMFPTPIRPL